MLFAGRVTHWFGLDFFECLCFLRSFATRFLSSQQSCVECGPQPHLNLDFSPKNGVNDLRLQRYIQKVNSEALSAKRFEFGKNNWGQSIFGRCLKWIWCITKQEVGYACIQQFPDFQWKPCNRWWTVSLWAKDELWAKDGWSKTSGRLESCDTDIHSLKTYALYCIYPFGLWRGVICGNGIYWSHWSIYREYLLPPVACVDMST